MKFKVMLAKEEVPQLDKLLYPSYISPLPNGFRFLYIPNIGIYEVKADKNSKINLKGENKLFDNLNGIYSHIVEGYCSNAIEGNSDVLKLYLFDCLPLQDFLNNKCDQTYEERLINLRHLLNENIFNYSEVIDLPTDIVYAPSEVLNFYKYYLTLNLKGAIIRIMDGKYSFGICKNDEICELKVMKEIK